MNLHANKLALATTGARNLLRNCVQISKGQSLLLITEDRQIDYFENAVIDIIADKARDMGATVLTLSTPRASGPDDVPEALNAAMTQVDHTVFLNRIGDQMRFRSLPGTGSKTMVYTLDVDTLASRAATYDHDFMVRMVALFNGALDSKKTWHITCPAGTDVSGEMPAPKPVSAESGGFAVRLFPMSVHKPISAQTMNGKIVLQRWVTGTNTHAYSPEVHYLKTPITIHVENGHSTDIQGNGPDVEAFRAHARMVAEKFGLDETLIHSWHHGLNPGTGYFAAAKDDPVRWNGMIFGSPRHLHFHTCGDYPPGEINWHIIDPTVRFDDEAFLTDGEVTFFQTDATQALLQEFGLTTDDMTTNQDIGL
ncbi:hypothetical protein ROA7450_02055 [Roseovarius albus]|uniref:2,5-dihydroxypyridine 5,6-dioxygenase n=1 Tax=Roseovarius albus TaxID=1247867 RepID=A0A1X6Z6E6_9RHOB|nr:hypothetical protein [Roseovarius albus]SLN42252.1 hypothetical protein ROA7450_02055 [Roseovarius albus]